MAPELTSRTPPPKPSNAFLSFLSLRSLFSGKGGKLKQPVSESGDPKARQPVGESPTGISAQPVPKRAAKLAWTGEILAPFVRVLGTPQTRATCVRNGLPKSVTDRVRNALGQTIGSAVRCDTIGTKEETPAPICRERPRKDFQGARPKGRRLRLGLQV